MALEKFRESGAPHIYTYFKQLPEGEQASESVLNFMERLDEEFVRLRRASIEAPEDEEIFGRRMENLLEHHGIQTAL